MPSKTRSSRKPRVSKSRQRDSWAWLLLLATLLFAAVIRIRLLQMPLERDEGEFAYMGQLMLQGVPPYLLAYNMKLPGIYAAYALIMALFGQTIVGIHLGLLLVNAATTVIIFLLARRLYDSYAAVFAGASFAILSLSPSFLALASHATHFVILPALGGVLLMLKAVDSDRLSAFFWCGLLLGLAYVMKQPGAFFIVFAVAYVAWTGFRRRPIALPRCFARCALLLLGAAVPFAATCIILVAKGVFHNFWFWTYSYAREYASQIPPSGSLQMLLSIIPWAIGPCAFIWAFAGIGLAALLWDGKARTHGVFLVGFLVFSFLSVCPGFYFRQHYFILALPAVALLTGVAAGSLKQLLGKFKNPALASTIPALLAMLALAHSVIGQRNVLFESSPNRACVAMYPGNPFVESLEIARYIRAHTSKDDRIAVIGSEPQIYFYSHRRSATGYIYAYPLMEQQKYALRMQKEMIKEIEAAQPAYVVCVNISLSLLRSPASPSLIFDWSDKYLREYYTLVGIVDLLYRDWTEYRWDEEVEGYSPSSPSFIYVLKRNSAR